MDSGPVFKFSNIFTSLITCYVLSNTESWPDIMNSYVKLYLHSVFQMICMEYFL
jgi:hypothetical protein